MAIGIAEPLSETDQWFQADGLIAAEQSFPVVVAPHRPPREVRRQPRIRKAPQEPISLAERRFQAGRPFVAPEGNLSPAYLATKRIFDVIGSLGLLLLLTPAMLVVLVILMINTRGKPLFWQRRVGYRGRQFTMAKFRTMVVDAEKRQQEVRNEKDGPIFKSRVDPRVTRIGRFLRKTSLDETPQLFNVLLGQMSLVGPRPPVGKEVVQYEAWQRRRLAVKPGLTCLWQVSGRSEIEFEDWVRMDIWYLRHQGLWTDLKLLANTPRAVLTGRGAY